MTALPTLTIHGVLMNIFNRGCLFMGESRRGKSDLALSLVDRGHSLIADDAVELFYNENIELQGKSPKNLEKYLHLREVGIINIRDHFPSHSVKEACRLDLIIELEDDLSIQNDHLNLMTTMRQLLNTTLPAFQLSADSKRPLPLIIETLVREYSLQQQGINAAQNFTKAFA